MIKCPVCKKELESVDQFVTDSNCCIDCEKETTREKFGHEYALLVEVLRIYACGHADPNLAKLTIIALGYKPYIGK